MASGNIHGKKSNLGFDRQRFQPISRSKTPKPLQAKITRQLQPINSQQKSFPEQPIVVFTEENAKNIALVERIAFKTNSFEQADKWDVKQHINLTLEERLSIARALKDRIRPKAKDVRQCHQPR